MAMIHGISGRGTAIQGKFITGQPSFGVLSPPHATIQPQMMTELPNPHFLGDPQHRQPSLIQGHSALMPSPLQKHGAPMLGQPSTIQRQVASKTSIPQKPGPPLLGQPSAIQRKSFQHGSQQNITHRQLQPAPLLGQPVNRPQNTVQPQVEKPRLGQSVRPGSVQPSRVAGNHFAIQRVGNGEAFQLPANLSNFGGGGGQPLPHPVRQKMESFFNTSFADVRIHVGHQAPLIGALAFTHGSNLYFAPGQYNPSTVQGQQLLGHELTHVMQQRAGRVRNPFGSGVAVVQDRSLELEADRMGSLAANSRLESNILQTKTPATPTVKPRAAVRIVQRFKDEKTRQQLDNEMDTLKRQVIEVLTSMLGQGEDWEKVYAKKGKEKASSTARDKLDGKNSNSSPSAKLTRIAFDQYWKSLTTSEKLELTADVGEIIASGLWEAIKATAQLEGSDQNESKPKKSKPKESKKKDNLLNLSRISELTKEDMDLIYDVYKARRDVLKKIEEGKGEIEKFAGKFGKEAGAFAGRLKNEAEFNKRMKASEQRFMALRKSYQSLKEMIELNDDTDRYDNEVEALDFAIMNAVNGPAMVYRGVDLNEETRKRHPVLCKECIGTIENSSRNRGFFGAVLHLVSRAQNFVVKEKPSDKLIKDVADALKNVVGRSWSRWTAWGFTPNGVKEIRNLRQTVDSNEYLDNARAVATQAAKRKSPKRNRETQRFYDVIAGMDLGDAKSLDSTLTEIKMIESLLR